MRFVPARVCNEPTYLRRPTYSFGLHTRPGSAQWIRLGFVQPWQERRIAEPLRLLGCPAQRSGQPCRHHEEVIETFEPETTRVQLRYPLFGREIDYSRNQWEYYAYDVNSDVRIPVGIPRNHFQLQNGDLVELLGDDQLWAVVLTELY